ncbi:MAG: MarR family transcriptional regulator [Acidobacteriota bacterium]
MLRDEIYQTKPFSSLEEEAFLNLQRSSGRLLQGLTHTLKPFRLSPTQYNVLRILKGAQPDTLTCGDVGQRLVTPEPDVTRLVDRLVRRELAERSRDEQDRRVVRVRITEAGLQLLDRALEPVESYLEGVLGHMSSEELQTLIQLLEKARQPLEAAVIS